MGSLRPKHQPDDGSVPENKEELQAMVWGLIEKLEEMGISRDQIFSALVTSVFKWCIDRSGSSWYAFGLMANALKQMAELGPEYESKKWGGFN